MQCELLQKFANMPEKKEPKSKEMDENRGLKKRVFKEKRKLASKIIL